MTSVFRLTTFAFLSVGCSGLEQVPLRDLPRRILPSGGAAVVKPERVHLSGQAGLVAFSGFGEVFTGMAVAQLADRGLVNPDSQIELYVPELAGQNRFPRMLRLRHLTSHTSGIRDLRRRPSNLDATVDAATVQAMAEHGRLRTEPGARQLYARLNVMILGLVIERVSGRRYDQYIRENILDPLEMGGTLLSEGAGSTWGDVRSTPADIGKFVQSLLADGVWEGRELLGEEGVRTVVAADRENRGWARRLGSGWSRGVFDGVAYLEHRGSQHVVRMYPRLDYGVVAVGNGRGARRLARTVFTTGP